MGKYRLATDLPVGRQVYIFAQIIFLAAFAAKQRRGVLATN